MAKERRISEAVPPQYLDVELNGGMTVAKYAARFELGLTTTVRSALFASRAAAQVLIKRPTQTPTVTFPRNKVLRTPDLNSDTLKMSIPAMRIICGRFVEKYSNSAELDIAELLPDNYLPSCIRGTVQLYAASPPVNMVWQLDYNSDETLAEPEIQLRPCGPTRTTVARPILKFQLTRKDGATLEVRVPDKLKAVWIDGAPVREEEVVMTDGCSLMSPAVSSAFAPGRPFDRLTNRADSCVHHKAMSILAEKLAASRRSSDLKPVIPAVAQGRIGSGKGAQL